MEAKKEQEKTPSSPFRLFASHSKAGLPISMLLGRFKHLYSNRSSFMSLGPWCPISSHLFALFLGSISVSPYEEQSIKKIKGIATALPSHVSISKKIKYGRTKVLLKRDKCLSSKIAFILEYSEDSDPSLHFLWKKKHFELMKLLHKKKSYELIATYEKNSLRICGNDKKVDSDIFYGMDKY